MSTPRAHAALGASSADRWMNCGASVRLSAGIPGTGETDYTREGTAAHKVLEMSLERNLDAVTYVDTTVEGVKVSEDMADAVQVCIDLVRKILAEHPGAQLRLEQRFSLADLNPPADMFGTSDITIFWPTGRKLWVIDYKHGQGYAVRAKGNPQLRYYGLGALLELERTIGPGQLATIVMTIVQPRAVHADGIIRTEEMSYMDLVGFADDLLEAAHRTLNPQSETKVGPWCRWCRAQPVCPAQKAHAASVAQLDFAVDEEPPKIETLSMEELLHIMERKPIIEAFLTSVAQYLEGELNAGRPVPGYKIVAKRAMRRWIEDESRVLRTLEDMGIGREDVCTYELKSPAQVEKIVGKSAMQQNLGDLVEKKSSGTTMAPEADSRPAVAVGAQSEFTAD